MKFWPRVVGIIAFLVLVKASINSPGSPWRRANNKNNKINQIKSIQPYYPLTSSDYRGILKMPRTVPWHTTLNSVACFIALFSGIFEILVNHVSLIAMEYIHYHELITNFNCWFWRVHDVSETATVKDYGVLGTNGRCIHDALVFCMFDIGISAIWI